MYTVLCKKISSCYDKYVHIASNETYNLKSIKKTAPLPNEVSWPKQGQIVPRKNSREYNFFYKVKERKRKETFNMKEMLRNPGYTALIPLFLHGN